jgi:hypothetical protein
MAEQATREIHLRRSTESVEIDHYTVHPGRGTTSIHFVEKDGDGKTVGGGDIDGVTKDEIGTASIESFAQATLGVPAALAAPEEKSEAKK